MIWANVGGTYIGIPDDGGIVVVDNENPADMSGVRCYVITRDLSPDFIGYYALRTVHEDGTTLEIAHDLTVHPAEAIDNLKHRADQHDRQTSLGSG